MSYQRPAVGWYDNKSKSYGGDTITDQLYDFATTGYAIDEETSATFRSLMLE